jgi:hypothetical protein
MKHRVDARAVYENPNGKGKVKEKEKEDVKEGTAEVKIVTMRKIVRKFNDKV